MALSELDQFELIPNGSFSNKNPFLQVYLDSTSLNEFKVCPRKYMYSIIYGFQPAQESVHLTFGLMLHKAVELYWTFRLMHQMDHRAAMLQVVHDIMDATWDKKLKKPWHSDHKAAKAKNRYTLIRTIVWYLDKYQNDPVRTIMVDVNGEEKVAVELPFQIHTKHTSRTTGDEYVLCGRLDRIGELNGVRYVTDIKSTGRSLGEDYFAQFNPHNQFTIYTIAAKSVYKVETDGILVDACYVVQSFSSFDRKIIQRNQEQLDRWYDDLPIYLKQLEEYAFEEHWPLNDAACGMYGGCPFRQVCAAPSAHSRVSLLRGEYKRRVWDPTSKRMDY